MRKVKDAKDLSSNELIYFKGHAKATYMSDGSTVEDALNNIEIGVGGDLSGYATKEELRTKQDIIDDLTTIREGAILGITSIQPSDLATVAKTGSYNDLTNKPTIPSAVTESTVSGWGFTKNTGTYSKPSSGIPKSDLASAVQTSLGKADTALQSHQDISGKQDKLVSGTNIKTINGTSILGSGNIIINGSGEGSSSNGNAYQLVNHGTSDTTFALTPNCFHVWDEVGSLTLTIGDEIAGVANEYIFQFTSGSEPTTFILPDSIKFNSDFTVEANKIYQISILNGLGTVMSWDKLI